MSSPKETLLVLLVGIFLVFVAFLGKIAALPSIGSLSPENIGTREATLQGKLIRLGGKDMHASVRFRYGRDVDNLNKETERTLKTSASEFSKEIGNLNPNTTYYFRAEAKNEKGKSYGNIVSFTTDKEKEDVSRKLSGEIIEMSIKIKEEEKERVFSLAEDAEVLINPTSERKAHIEEIRKEEGGCARIPEEVFEKYRLRDAELKDIKEEDWATLFFNEADQEIFIKQIILDR